MFVTITLVMFKFLNKISVNYAQILSLDVSNASLPLHVTTVATQFFTSKYQLLQVSSVDAQITSTSLLESVLVIKVVYWPISM